MSCPEARWGFGKIIGVPARRERGCPREGAKECTIIEGGRIWNGSTALKVLDFPHKLGVVDLLKTATSSDSRIQNKRGREPCSA